MISIYKDLLQPVFFRADAEKIHETGLRVLRTVLRSKTARRITAERFAAPEGLATECFGIGFANPIGLAAGFDKNAVVVDQMAALGFGFVEVGTVTLDPQPGNEKPRLFRLPEDQALINRLGFNNKGAREAARRLALAERNCVIGVNIGKNKSVPNEDAEQNYLECFELVHEHADYITVNVSSPNTPNLRELQEGEKLDSLLSVLQEANLRRAVNGVRKPLLLKIAPDLSFEALDEIIDICKTRLINAVIATNTTVERTDLKTHPSVLGRIGAGGLSGKPLESRANLVIQHIFRRTQGSLPVIGVGGVFSAEDAFEKIASGASLVQGYTGFIYNGPGYARDINRGLNRLLEENGFETVGEACGTKV